jgi:hypothetical protein
MQKTASRDARAAVIVQVFFDYARGWTGSDAALTDFEIIRHHIVNTVTIHISLDIAVFVDNRVIDILPALKREDSHGTAPLGWDIVVYDVTCS